MDPETLLGLVLLTASEREAQVIERNREVFLQRIEDMIARTGECAVCPPCPAFCGNDRAHEVTWQNGAKVWKGNETAVFYPKGKGKSGLEALDAYYALVPADDVIQSHDPFTFAESGRYPRELQERAYDRDQLEQVKVIRQAEAFEPSFAVNTNPDAVNGPPIIDDQGFVLGGNSRAMAIKRVLAEGAENPYTKALDVELPDCGGVYGLAGAPVSGMMLVRVLTSSYDPTSISRDLNRALTQNLDLAAQAVSLGKMLPARLFETIGQAMFGEADATLMAALTKQSAEVIRVLQDAKVITPQNLGDYVMKSKGRLTGKLSTTGRHMIRLAIVGALVGDKEWMALITARLEKLCENIAPAMMTLHVEDPNNERGFNLVPSIRPGIGLLAHLGSSTVPAFEEHFRTREIAFGEAGEEAVTLEQKFPQVYNDPLTAIMSKWLVEAQQKPRVAYEATRRYMYGTPGRAQVMMFGEDIQPEQLRIDTLGERFPAASPTTADVQRTGIVRWLAGLGEEPELGLFGSVRQPNPAMPPVDEKYWMVTTKYGSAGGPEVVVLTDEGYHKAARVATGLTPTLVSAIETLAAYGGGTQGVKIETEHGLTPFAEEHWDALSGLLRGGYIERVEVYGAKYGYQLTQKGMRALEDITEETERLRKRAEKSWQETKERPTPVGDTIYQALREASESQREKEVLDKHRDMLIGRFQEMFDQAMQSAKPKPEERSLREIAAGKLGARLSALEREGWVVVSADPSMKASDTEILGSLPGAKVRQLLDAGVTLEKRGKPKSLRDHELYDIAKTAYSGTSWSPERRAESEVKQYLEHLEKVRAILEKWADSDEQKAQVDEEYEAYKRKYTEMLKAWLYSRHGLVSAFIAGPSKFPARRMEKHHDRQHKKLVDLLEWSKFKLKKIYNRWHPRGVRSDDPEAIAKLRANLAEREKNQDIYKRSNRIIKRKKETVEEKLAELKAAGLPSTPKLFEKDYAGRIGYPSYLLKNNNAEMRRLRKRIEQLEQEQGRKFVQFEVEDRIEGEVEIEDDPDDMRVRLIFGGKPEKQTRTRLKANGFKWAPSAGAWQRLSNDTARWAVTRALDLDDENMRKVKAWIAGEDEKETAAAKDIEDAVLDIDVAIELDEKEAPEAETKQ